jgi:putative transposase
MNQVLEHRPERLPLATACRALGLNRSTVYARRKQCTAPKRTSRKHSVQPRALCETERTQVLEVLHNEQFCDQPPAQVYATLLDEGQYLCSVSTMHRLLRKQGENGDRRPVRAAQHHAIPRLRAQQPNEVWTWDITKLATIRAGQYLSLYVVLDLFSRFVVAWMLSSKENSALAQQLMQEAMARYHIAAGQLTIHQDRGSPMIARSYLDLMSELGATSSHSRPRVSNDNAFSESQFKTLKYQPDYPGRFANLAHARSWCEGYFDWYNFKHHHSALASFTPEQVFTNRHENIAKQREQVLLRHYEAHPERFVQGKPRVKRPAEQVLINPLIREDGSVEDAGAVNFPTLSYVKNTLFSY